VNLIAYLVLRMISLNSDQFIWRRPSAQEEHNRSTRPVNEDSSCGKFVHEENRFFC